MPAVVSEPVADLATAADKARADDRLVTSPDTLLGDAETLLSVTWTAQAVLVRKLRAAQVLDATAELCGRSLKRWLVEEQRLTEAEAGRLARLVRQLPDHPATEAAFDAGDIGPAHAAAILTALHALPAEIRDTVEPHLIERAREFPPEEIAGYVDELLQALGIDTDGDHRREHRHATRGVDVAKTLHGTRSISGTLTPEVGERFETALALAAHKTSPEDHRTPRQRRHDALGVIADAFLAQSAPSFTGAPRTVIVTLDLDTLEGRLREAWLGTPPMLSGTAPISPDTARRLACDAELIPVVLGGNREVIEVGQAGREFTTAVRRAAYVRDGGRCAFPRCRNRCLELHHIRFRRNRGTNSLSNAAWLCAFHHWLAHEGGWTLERDTNGDYLWTNPGGLRWTRHLKTA